MPEVAAAAPELAPEASAVVEATERVAGSTEEVGTAEAVESPS